MKQETHHVSANPRKRYQAYYTPGFFILLRRTQLGLPSGLTRFCLLAAGYLAGKHGDSRAEVSLLAASQCPMDGRRDHAVGVGERGHL